MVNLGSNPHSMIKLSASFFLYPNLAIPLIIWIYNLYKQKGFLKIFSCGLRFFIFLVSQDHEAETSGDFILCFKEICTRTRKKRLIVLALSVKDVLKLITLMIITYLSTPAQCLPLQLTSILQLHQSKNHCPPLA